MTPASLEFDGVSKWYGQVSALTEVDFHVGPGVTGLVGQNGAGKSTLLKLAAGLLRPSLGTVRIAGQPPTLPRARAVLGYCTDLDRFYETVSGRRFVTWMLRLSGVPNPGPRAEEMLEWLGLRGAMDRPIAGYSKGMRQRVKLAQALGHEPSVLLLDEPMTGLDPVARHHIGQVVREMGARGVAVLVSSHVLHELQSVATRFVLMHQGRLLAEGGLSELREQLAERPRLIAIRTREPRRLAARLCSMPRVGGVRLGDDGRITVETHGGLALWQQLTVMGAEADGLVDEIAPLDDSLEAVFGYLLQ